MFLLLLAASIPPLVHLADSDLLVITECAITVSGRQRPSVDPNECTNEMDDRFCDLFFPITPNQQTDNNKPDQDYKVPSSCSKPDFKELAQSCRRTCATCCNDPRFDCNDERPKDVCIALRNHTQCGRPEYVSGKPAMDISLLCPSTCGTCNQSQVSPYCPNRQGGCALFKYVGVSCDTNFMKENCSTLCQVPRTGVCDLASLSRISSVLVGFSLFLALKQFGILQ